MQAVRISQINTSGATSSEVSIANIKRNINKGLPRLHHLPEFKIVKGRHNPVALVGGGSSLNDNLDDLRNFKATICAGSSHDFLVSSGITPTYAVICDPDPISALYLTRAQIPTTYLVASHCDEEVFKVLNGKNVLLWHCHSDDAYTKLLMQLEDNYEAVGGGCTVGLRALSIAIMLGYSNIHFFGYDSCLGDGNKPYAYEADKQDNMLSLLGDVYPIKIGKESPSEKTYYCLGYQIAQAQHFIDFYRKYKHLFKPTFHGSGLLSDIYNTGLKGETP